jgi:hypothetical protein
MDSYASPTEPIDPFYHRLLDRSEIRSVILILPQPQLARSQHLQSIEEQRSFIGSLISEYHSRKEVGYTLPSDLITYSLKSSGKKKSSMR